MCSSDKLIAIIIVAVALCITAYEIAALFAPGAH